MYVCVEWEFAVAPKSRDITCGLRGCQGDIEVFIFQVVRRVIMVYDRDRGGNLKPVQWVMLWERDGLLREKKLELKLLGLGAIQNKWGSIRVMVDDGRGEMAGVCARTVRFTHCKHTPTCTCMHT